MNQAVKQCTKCQIIKSTTEFYRNRTRKDGFNEWCKSCLRVAYAKRPRDAYRKYQRKYYSEHRERMNEQKRRLYYKHRQKRLKYNTKYLAKHKDDPQFWDRRRKNYQKCKKIRFGLWRGDIVTVNNKHCWKMAQYDLAPKILAMEGFSDIFSFPQTLRVFKHARVHTGHFDLLAKRDGKIYAFEVTIGDKKRLNHIAITLAQYLELKYFVLFVKPDLSGYYYLMPISTEKMLKCRFPEIRLPMKLVRNGLKSLNSPIEKVNVQESVALIV